jgi:hypothetical protein
VPGRPSVGAVDRLVLCTFQRLARVRQLRDDGALVGDWDRLPPFERVAYPSMVTAMEHAGIQTGGRPPVWAWQGTPTLHDVHSLYGSGPELGTGVATVEFAAPADLVFLSDYGDWNDHLSARLDDPGAPWEPLPRNGWADDLVQACVPCLHAGWVRDVRPLPTSGWPDGIDLDRPA